MIDPKEYEGKTALEAEIHFLATTYPGYIEVLHDKVHTREIDGSASSIVYDAEYEVDCGCAYAWLSSEVGGTYETCVLEVQAALHPVYPGDFYKGFYTPLELLVMEVIPEDDYDESLPLQELHHLLWPYLPHEVQQECPLSSTSQEKGRKEA